MSANSISVITIPLKTEIWQEDVLNKRFNVCRSIYNAMLGAKLKAYDAMSSEEDYKKSLEVIYTAYKCKDEKERARIKKTPEYKEAQAIQAEKHKEYGFSQFNFGAAAIAYADHFKDIIPTTLAQLSIGRPMWAAFEKLLFGNGETCHYKNRWNFNSIVTDGRSGIRIVNEAGKTAKALDKTGTFYCMVTSRKGKDLKMPLRIDHKNQYLVDMLERDIHTVRIIRKRVKDKYRYSVQLSVTGIPAEKYDKDGNIKHPVKEGKLGIYIDTRSITIAGDFGIKTIDLSIDNKDAEKIKDIQRYLDNSRRATNPQNFNADGTVKNGIVVNGERTKLKWKFSKSYKAARAEKANLERKQAEKRKLRSNIIANEILALGNNITINDYSFANAMEKSTEDKTTKAGTPASKHRGGRTIAETAPAQIVTILRNKVISAGGVLVKKKIEPNIYKKDYREYYAKEFAK